MIVCVVHIFSLLLGWLIFDYVILYFFLGYVSVLLILFCVLFLFGEGGCRYLC